MRVVASALLILTGIAAHGAPAAFDIRATDAWIRWLPAGLPGAGYLTLTNAGGMLPIDSIILAPNVSVDFAQAGYHFMLMQPRHPLRPGERVSITLWFSSGQSITVPFAVRGANASGQS